MQVAPQQRFTDERGPFRDVALGQGQVDSVAHQQHVEVLLAVNPTLTFDHYPARQRTKLLLEGHVNLGLWHQRGLRRGCGRRLVSDCCLGCRVRWLDSLAAEELGRRCLLLVRRLLGVCVCSHRGGGLLAVDQLGVKATLCMSGGSACQTEPDHSAFPHLPCALTSHSFSQTRHPAATPLHRSSRAIEPPLLPPPSLPSPS
eukprot:scaffold15484_cov30-Tisochrysis_lutea.AAC.1